jgi:hypothetical protein
MMSAMVGEKINIGPNKNDNKLLLPLVPLLDPRRLITLPRVLSPEQPEWTCRV